MGIELIEYSGLYIHGGQPELGVALHVPGRCLMGWFEKSDTGYRPFQANFEVVTDPDKIIQVMAVHDKQYKNKRVLPFDESALSPSVSLVDKGLDIMCQKSIIDAAYENLGLLVTAGIEKAKSKK